MNVINQPRTIEVDGTSYVVHKLPPRVSIPVLTKILKIAAPLIGEAVSGKFDQLDSEESDEGGISLVDSLMDSEVDLKEVASMFFDRLGEDDIYDLMKRCFSSVLHGNANLSEIMEAHFMGKEMHMLKVLYNVLEVHYGNFFVRKEQDSLQKDLEQKGLKSKKQK